MDGIYYLEDSQNDSVLRIYRYDSKIEISFSLERYVTIHSLRHKSSHNSTFYVEVEDGIVIIKDGSGYYLHNSKKYEKKEKSLLHYYPVKTKEVKVDEASYYQLTRE